MSKVGSYVRIGLIPGLLMLAMIILEPADLSLPSLLAAALHECGHLAAATALGIELRSLDIGPLGATLRIRGSLISYRREWLLCAAGPAVNIICAVLSYLHICGSGTTEGAAVWFCAVSAMLAVLNLLPVDGFDGGRMLACVAGAVAGPLAASRAVAVCSFLSVIALWMLSVYLLMRHGTSLSLFIFSLSVFNRIFLENTES